MNRLTKVIQQVLPMTAFLLISHSALACSPMPGAKPLTVFDKTQAAALVFEGAVIAVNDNTVTVKVKQYLKGKGADEVIVQGFNMTSCDDFIGVDDQRLFFAAPQAQSTNLQAVYDGAFGSTSSVDSKNISQATVSAYTTTINAPLDISIPKANWQSGNDVLDIWVNLKYIGLKNGQHTWQLKDFGQN